ncbi:MAG: DUF2344 domain-containing protein [Lachnospiraceae bacterium]|nr:DUF2344 domain-containing protein [Lachnospiraceae bacterium]
MKIRIKFAKTGTMKFIGHLDIMRYFQKVMRRAEVDITYSEGFSPHQKMSFAAPLGVGLTSQGEYFDIDVHSTKDSAEMLRRLNDTMVEGMKVLSYRLLPEDSKNAMSLVAAADYNVTFRESYAPDIDFADTFNHFMAQESIEIVKKTKKSEQTVDIRPMILEYQIRENTLFLKLAAGSENNLKPELVMQAFYQYLDLSLPEFALLIERLELYGKSENGLLPLEDFGTDIV